MKFKFFSLSALVLFTGALPAAALPLQEGIYRIGSKYIQIAAQGDRVCYEGVSYGFSMMVLRKGLPML